jgi:enoyl-CoA hydratase/carnithine racemase
MTSSATKAVEITHRNGVAWLTLNRPQVINAINHEVRSLIPHLLMELDNNEDVRVIVVTGAGQRGFCAGADLKEGRSAASSAVGAQALWIEAFARITKPTIASIHGYCLGGGLEIALACDIRIASADASFGLPEPTLGLIPGGGGTQRLPRLIGLAWALDMLITADRIDAAQAHRVGLVSRLAPTREALAQQTEHLASRIASLPALAVRSVKRAARIGLEREFASGLELEQELFTSLAGSRDRLDGGVMLRNRREPMGTETK